ncbi:hypothetical protein PCANB_000798 [Pneumocystis canis]|nr:hypothetical protein PCK1_000781 [Pneumocystis canis]KAG5437367.1 hypothetical protein PCANB_000798 [Pneumocystis canis]
MIGDLATKLMFEAHRAMRLDVLPAYETERVQAIVREISALEEASKELLNKHGGETFSQIQKPDIAIHLLIQHLCKLRNKRCLLAYHHVRITRLAEACWTNTFSLDSVLLLPSERTYLRAYTSLLSYYTRHWPGIDFTGILEPPTDLYVNVRVLRDIGEIQTEYGAITLNKNSQFFLRLTDVEGLVRQGYLQKVS